MVTALALIMMFFILLSDVVASATEPSQKTFPHGYFHFQTPPT